MTASGPNAGRAVASVSPWGKAACVIRADAARAAHHAGHTSAERADAQHSISRDSAASAPPPTKQPHRTMAGRPPRRGVRRRRARRPRRHHALTSTGVSDERQPGQVYERPVTADGRRRKPSLKTKSQTSLRRPSTAGSTGGRTLRRPKDRATLSQQEATKHLFLYR